MKDASDAADETNSEVSGGLHHLIVAPTVRDDVALDKRTRGRRSREIEKGSCETERKERDNKKGWEWR